MKPRLKRTIVTLLTRRLLCQALRPLWKGRASVFLLHRLYTSEDSHDSITHHIICSTIDRLRKAGARFVSLRTLFEYAEAGVCPPPGSVSFTIDDGFADQSIIAEAILECGAYPTIFLVSGFIDRITWPWDDQLAYSIDNCRLPRMHLPSRFPDVDLSTPALRNIAKSRVQDYVKELAWSDALRALEDIFAALECRPPSSPPDEYQPMSWNQIRKLEEKGVEFGPHSVTHRITSRLPAEDVAAEVRTSWSRLASELVRPLNVYAWPTGRDPDFSQRDIAIAKKHGMRGAMAVNNNYSEFNGPSADDSHLFALSRFALSADIADNLQYGTAIERAKQLLRIEP